MFRISRRRSSTGRWTGATGRSRGICLCRRNLFRDCAFLDESSGRKGGGSYQTNILFMEFLFPQAPKKSIDLILGRGYGSLCKPLFRCYTELRCTARYRSIAVWFRTRAAIVAFEFRESGESMPVPIYADNTYVVSF